MNSKDLYPVIINVLSNHLASDGMKMHKKISSGGFLTPPTYDERTVYTMDEMNKLNKEGFTTETDLGVFLFNALKYRGNYE